MLNGIKISNKPITNLEKMVKEF